MNNTTPGYYALKPLSNILINENAVPLQQYVSGIGLTGTASFDFNSIYLDGWAQEFLAATEHFISVFFPPSITRKIDPDIARILKVKVALGNVIPGGAAAMLPAISDTAQLKEVRSALQKALLANLSEGYAVTAVCVSKDNEVTLYRQYDPIDNNPVPLRAFPQVPALSSQAITPTYPDAGTIARAIQIDYSFTFSSNNAYQDTIYISIDHPHTSLNSAIANNDTDLFNSLAQFAIAYPILQKDLPEKYNPAEDHDPVLVIAIKTFADMAEAIAAAWAGYWSKHIVHSNTIPGYTYSLNKQFDAAGPGYIESVTLKMHGNETALVPILFLENTQMTASRISDSEYIYKSATKGNGGNMKIKLAGINIFSAEEWNSSMCIVRNNFEGIDPAFVFKTAVASFAGPTLPEIVQNGKITLDNAPRIVALANLFITLFTGVTAPPSINVTISYATIIHEGLPPVSVPVLQIKDVVYSEALVNEVDNQLTNWLNTNEPDNKGHFVMQLTVFNVSNKPVLILNNIQFE